MFNCRLMTSPAICKHALHHDVYGEFERLNLWKHLQQVWTQFCVLSLRHLQKKQIFVIIIASSQARCRLLHAVIIQVRLVFAIPSQWGYNSLVVCFSTTCGSVIWKTIKHCGQLVHICTFFPDVFTFDLIGLYLPLTWFGALCTFDPHVFHQHQQVIN